MQNQALQNSETRVRESAEPCRNRRQFLALLGGLATSAVLAPHSAEAQQGFFQPLQNGMYLGYWKDGRAMMDRVEVSGNQIYKTRVAGGDVQGRTAVFIRSGQNTYNTPSGHQIFITGPRSFTWTNRHGRNGLSYAKQ
ncbi:MAG: hypothetical protein RDA78_11010 [Roseibium sp.]|uniref:hypothetical protein n=1 Tax=Roseibium sp. TaxID=1936156 RepID=UPI003D9C27C0